MISRYFDSRPGGSEAAPRSGKAAPGTSGGQAGIRTWQVSVVVPVHDEAGNIRGQVDEIFSALENRLAGFELIYVNDGSTDDTARELSETRARHGKRFRVLTHESARGQSTAVYSGIRAARHDWIVTLDGDGQNDPADIPALLRTAAGFRGGRVMVCGHRVARSDTWFRRACSVIANAVRRVLLRDGTPDTGCGLKVFPRQMFLDMPYFDHMHRYLPALARRQGGDVVSVPVSHRPRRAGVSKYGLNDRLWAGIADMLGVAWLQRREKRPARIVEEYDDEL